MWEILWVPARRRLSLDATAAEWSLACRVLGPHRAGAAARRSPEDEEDLMDVPVVARIVWLRRTLRRRERWTPERLRAHQQRELADLRAYAIRRSPFYRDVHHGLTGAPLDALPVLTKATLMDNFDR